MKILHLADIHANDKDIDEIEKCLTYILETAKKEQPSLHIIAGDLTNSMNCKLDSRSTRVLFDFVSTLANIAPVAIVTGTPSHDGNSPEIFKNASPKVWVSSEPEQIYLYDDPIYGGSLTSEKRTDLPSAVISLVPAVTKQYFQAPGSIEETDQSIGQKMGSIFSGLGAMADEFQTEGVPHILIGHWQVGGAFVSENQQLIGMDIEVSKEHIALSKADIVCLGHIHMSQKIGANIFYSGSVYRKNWGETEDKGFYIHEHSANDWFSRFILTPTRKLIKLTADFTDCPIDELTPVLYTYSSDEYKDAMVRCEFVVFRDDAEKLDKQKIENFFLSAGAHSADVRFIRVPRENVRSEHLLKLTKLKDKLQEQATIKNEPIPDPAILDKAELLETLPSDKIIETVAA